MRQILPLLAMFMVICAFADPAAAQETETKNRVDTATRAPSDAFVDERAVTTVDAETIDRKQATSTTEAIEGEPGVFVQSTNRGAGTVILRGLVGPENLIYVDGVRFNQSTFRTGPNQYLNTFDPNALDRIEVVRGPGSVLFGGGAMGGVVHLLPEDIALNPLTELTGRYQTADDTVGVGAAGTAKAGDLPVFVNAGATFLRAGDLRIGSNGGSDLVVPNLDDDGKIQPSDYDTLYWRARAAFRPTDTLRFRLDYFGVGITDAPRTDRIGDGEIRFYDNRDDLIYLTVEHEDIGVVDQMRANLSFHRTSERVDRFNCRRIDLEQGSRTPDPLGCARLDRALVDRRRVNTDVVNTFGTSFAGISDVPGDVRLSYGFETYSDAVDSARADGPGLDGDLNPRDRGNFSTGSTYSTLGAYSTMDWEALTFGEHALGLRLGGRVERFRAFAPDVSDELGDVEFDEWGAVANAGINYFWGGKVHSYLTWHQGFRAPNLQETTVLGDTGNSYEVPNPELGPERSDTFELGTKVAIDDWVRFDGAAFVAYLSDRITREEATLLGNDEVNDKPVERRVNSDTAYFYGVELGARSGAFFDVHLHGNFTWYDGAVETEDEDDTFEPGPLHDLVGDESRNYANPRRLVPARWTAGATWEPTPAWYVTAWGTGAGAQDKLAGGDRSDLRICQESPGILYSDLGAECPGSDAWATLNLRAGYRHENVTIDLAFENLLDQRYRMHGSGYPAPGFNTLATLTYRTF